ncbi:MAG: lytic transglycosylase domain-containing protein, partial [Caulobacteraceae bacterium]
IFYRDGRPTTVAELYANLTKGGAGAPAPRPEAPDDGFVRYASARRLDRIEAERQLVNMVLRGPTSPDGGFGSGFGGGASGGGLSVEMLRVLSQASHRATRR